jgi:hypothetical protein
MLQLLQMLHLWTLHQAHGLVPNVYRKHIKLVPLLIG